MALNKVVVLTTTGVLAASVTVGIATETATLAAVEFTTTKAESVTRAVIVDVPTVVGVQENVYGAVVSVPITTPFSRKSTCVMVEPGLAVAEAESVVAVPTVAVDGAVREMVGSVATPVTVVAAESVYRLRSSTVRARRE